MKMKRKTTIGLIISIIFFGSLTAIIIWSFNSSQKNKPYENAVSSKEGAYSFYVSLEKPDAQGDSNEDKAKMMMTAHNAIYKAKEYYENEEYQITNDGNEWLEKLREEAIVDLNESISFVLNNNPTHKNLKSVKLYIDEPFISGDNKALFNQVEEEVESNIATQEEQERERLGDIQTGYSERETKLILGNPITVMKSSEAEFWTYKDMVLTMKNGYVYNIHYSD